MVYKCVCLRTYKWNAMLWNKLSIAYFSTIHENFFWHISGNPLVCSCSSYNQKIWLRQHRKWLDAERRGSKIGPQCHEPTPISDRYLLTVKDSELCPLPSVNSLQLSNINPTSFLVTWDSPDTNLTGLKGFIVAYHRLDKNDQVRKDRVSSAVRGFQVNELTDNTLYLVCVVTRGSSYTRSPNDIIRTNSKKQQVNSCKICPWADVINKFFWSWSNVLWLVKFSHVTWNIQSECFITVTSCCIVVCVRAGFLRIWVSGLTFYGIYHNKVLW